MKSAVAFLLALSSAYAAEVSLYAINSPNTLNWETPRTLFLSTMRSSINPTRQGYSNHTIGHAFIGLKCDNQEDLLSGMTSGKGFSSRNNLFNEKHGLSVILQDNPGRFETHERVKRDIDFYSKSPGRMSVIKLEVTNEQCLKAFDWYKEFAARPEHIYGGIGRRPLKGEGAGCSAYVMSYLEYANIDFEFYNKIFEQTIYIPNELLGGEFGDRVVPLSAIMGNRMKLAVKAENTLEVRVYDPNTMYFWITKNWQDVKRGKKSAELESYEASTSLLDKVQVLNLKLR